MGFGLIRFELLQNARIEMNRKYVKLEICDFQFQLQYIILLWAKTKVNFVIK